MRDKTVEPSAYYGRVITGCTVDDQECRITFADGTTIAIWDDGQSCCEERFMSTDDDPRSLIGDKLTAILSKEAESSEDDDGWSCHETMFVEVGTDKGSITLVNHNVHNGYYGGFALRVTEE